MYNCAGWNMAAKFVDHPVTSYKCGAEMMVAVVCNLLESVWWIASLFLQCKLMAHFQKTNEGRFVSLHYGNALFKALHLRTTCIVGGSPNRGGRDTQRHFICCLHIPAAFGFQKVCIFPHKVWLSVILVGDIPFCLNIILKWNTLAFKFL
jgi:hypothetical protein